MEYYLEPYYDSRKSFYGKAKVIENTDDNNTIKILYSYGTEVAKITFNGNHTIYEYYGKYSQTTTRHQKEFFRQEGIGETLLKKLLKKEGKIKI